MGKCSSKQSKKVLMVGLDGGGKTSLLYKVRIGEVVTTVPTIGFNVETVTVSKNVPLTIWDIGGQERIRSLWRHYYQGTDALLFVVDSTDGERMSQAREELLNILKNSDMAGIPVVIMANKQDLPNALKPEEVAELLHVDKIITERHCHVEGVSSMTSEGLQNAFQTLGKYAENSKK